MNSPETKKKYSKRFEVFLDFVDIDGATIEKRLYDFYQKAKSDKDWLQDSLIQFIMFQKERALKGETAESTRNEGSPKASGFHGWQNLVSAGLPVPGTEAQHPFSFGEKLVERTMQHIRDRRECFDDCLPCGQTCKLKHVRNWLRLFAGYHNSELTAAK